MSPRNFQEIFLGQLTKALEDLILIILGVFILGLDRHWHFHRLDELYTPTFMLAEGCVLSMGKIRHHKGLEQRPEFEKGYLLWNCVPWTLGNAFKQLPRTRT